MKTIKGIIERLNESSIYVDEYREDDKPCGYELNTYTGEGVNQIIFLDFRNTELDPKKAKDFLEVWEERIESIDIDEEIDLNRQNEDYKKAFTLSDSVEDFKNWKKSLENVFKNPSKKTPQQRQFEQTKDKFKSSISEMQETIELIPTKGGVSEDCQKTNILNAICHLEHCINGIELEDFTPNDYSGDFKLSYS